MSDKWLLIGDPHFEMKNLEMMSRACCEIVELIEEHKPNLCVVLGDTLHTHEKIHLLALSKATEWFREIAKRCRLVVLIGNHDRVNNQDFMSPIHPFVGLEGAENIRIVSETYWDHEENLMYVPYVPPGRFQEALKSVDYTPGDELAPRAIFAHQEFRGCSLGIHASEKGDPWSGDWPQVFSGHIHAYHTLPGVVYVGTFHQQNYGEDPDKAVMLVTDQSNQRRFPLKSVPRRVTIDMPFEDLPMFSERVPPNCQVKVVIHIDATERRALEKNPHYQSLKSVVDRVVTRVTGDKTNVAQSMIEKMKGEGRLEDRPVHSVEEIVRGMLSDDPISMKIFEEEIL